MHMLLFILALTLPLQGKWLSDHNQAIEKAHQESKPLLVVFLGSGWCPWSDKLTQEILNKREFADILRRDFILLKVHCPENGEEPLKERYQVEQCPHFLLIDPSGEKIAEVEYLSLDSGAYADHFKSLLTDFHQLKKVVSNLEKLSFTELKGLYEKARRLANEGLKNAIVQAGVKVDPGAEFLLEEYRTLVSAGRATSDFAMLLKEKIASRDPDNALGARLKLALIEFERLMTHEPLLDYVKQFGSRDQKSLWQVEMALSQYFFSHSQLEEALQHAEASYEAAPQEEKSQVAQAIEYFKKHAKDL